MPTLLLLRGYFKVTGAGETTSDFWSYGQDSGGLTEIDSSAGGKP